MLKMIRIYVYSLTLCVLNAGLTIMQDISSKYDAAHAH